MDRLRENSAESTQAPAGVALPGIFARFGAFPYSLSRNLAIFDPKRSVAGTQQIVGKMSVGLGRRRGRMPQQSSNDFQIKTTGTRRDVYVCRLSWRRKSAIFARPVPVLQNFSISRRLAGLVAGEQK
jgi:hypothetical protein